MGSLNRGKRNKMRNGTQKQKNPGKNGIGGQVCPEFARIPEPIWSNKKKKKKGRHQGDAQQKKKRCAKKSHGVGKVKDPPQENMRKRKKKTLAGHPGKTATDRDKQGPFGWEEKKTAKKKKAPVNKAPTKKLGESASAENGIEWGREKENGNQRREKGL